MVAAARRLGAWLGTWAGRASQTLAADERILSSYAASTPGMPQWASSAVTYSIVRHKTGSRDPGGSGPGQGGGAASPPAEASNAPPPDLKLPSGPSYPFPEEILELAKRRVLLSASKRPVFTHNLAAGAEGTADASDLGLHTADGIRAFLRDMAVNGAPVGPWVEHVIAAETTLPWSYEVGIRISAFDLPTANQAVALVQRVCQLCDVPVRGPGFPRAHRTLISVPKSPFKYKKRSMTQLWWGYHERTFAFPVRTQRRLLFLLHCLRQARFPLAEVKVSIKHRTAVYASHQEGPFGNAKVKRVEGKASLGQEPPVAEKEVVEREAATAM